MIRIHFLSDAPKVEDVATSVQTQTYYFLRTALLDGRRSTLAECLAMLEIEKPRTFMNRLVHLQEKGLIRFYCLLGAQ